MNQPLRTSSAASLVVLASMIAGCAAPQHHVAAASNYSGKADGNVGLGTRALAALNSNNPTLAVQLAEQAAAKSPQDEGVRNLLANAYFAAGRFASAEAAYKDALTINANQPQAILKLALVEIAQGKDAEAVSLLNSARSVLDPSDYGLALALAGRPQLAIAVLEPAARQVGADATVRQNLALAYAFAGNWDEARLVASQDVPGNLLDARIQQWMQLAKPKHASDQVAALIGVTPAPSDAGEPVQLALNKSDTRQAQAAPAPAAPKAAETAKTAPAVAPAAAPASKPAVVSIATPAAPPPTVVAVAPAPPPPRSTLATMAASAMSEAKAVLAAVLPHHDAPAAKPHRVAAVVRPATRRGNAQVVVQLGAYGSADRVLAAWNREARKYGALKAYLPMSARFASAKGVFYRLSVRGFDSVGEANSLCNALRRQGGSCFVRNFAGDQPVQYASR
jgi:D-alanyl-D-alanine carboxypeptidase